MDMDRLVTWHNGQKAQPTFSVAEMTRRQDNLRRYLAEAKLDAALLTSYHNINYFSDFLYCYFGRRFGFVVTPKKAISISAGIDGGQPYRRTFGDNITYTDWRRDNFFFALQNELKGCRRIGIEFDHVNLDYHRLLKEALPNVEMVDIGAPSMWMRTIKSAEEIALIRNGARIADLGGVACVGAIKAGAGEHEVALASTGAMVREIARTYPHAELLDTWTWFQSGINTDGAHNPVTSRKILPGDILSLNCFPMIAGYYTALERTLFSEHASDAHLKLWEFNCEVHRRGIALIKPGARCCDIAAELNEMYRSKDCSAEVPILRLRPLLRRALPLLRPRGRRGAARGYRDGAAARHGGLDGADDHAAGRRVRRRGLSRARYPGAERERGGEHHRVPLRPGA